MRPDRGKSRRDAPHWLQGVRERVVRTARVLPNAGVRISRAWGVELDRHALHLVCVSGASNAPGDGPRVRIDDIRHVALPPGLVDGSDIVAPDAVGHILRAALAAHQDGDAPGLSMALCPSVVLSRDVPWTSLLPGYTVTRPQTEDVIDALGPWVRWHAQRISGLDDADLLVDWQPSTRDRTLLRLTAAQTHYLAVREGVAAHAGATLQGVIDAGESALRACRFVVGQCLRGGDDQARSTSIGEGGASVGAECRDDGETGEERPLPMRIACVWCSETAAAAWTFAAHRPDVAAVSCALPAIDTVSADAWIDALHVALRSPQHLPSLVIVCGHDAAMDAIGGLSALSAKCGYPVIRFDVSACDVHAAVMPAALAMDCAVALGAALHGLLGSVTS
ncbi:type IV pilus biogenesis protein PilM [Robbsia andropogonis]|uniref:hypothetical protein n=1 Tax=Robbsia andropogonis TaxID=28092 RepID=UPI0012F8FAB4|nr:hypothetical protein [Robbsia andropogonis]